MKYARILRSLNTVFCCAIALLFLTSCNPREYRTEAAQVPQLVLVTPTDPKTFNYANNQTFPTVFPFIYEGLTKENGLTGEYEPALAESWKFSSDNKRVVFTLRSNLKWSDGKPLTADDVVFTYQDIVFNPLIPTDQKESIQIGVKKIFPQVRKISDRKVEFILPEPFAPLLAATAAPDGIMILPKHALAEAVNTKLPDGNPRFISTWGTNTDPKQIITNGAYVIDSYSPNQRLVLKRNPYYWRRDENEKQLPYIDRIIWSVVENQDTQLLRFRSGDLDVMGDTRPLRPEYFSLLKREEERGNFTVLNGGPWSGVLYLTFNLSKANDQNGKPFVDPIKSKWFNTLEFRQAIAYAIDRDRINTNLFRGLGVVQNSPISVQSPFTLKEGLRVYNYDLEKSRDLLKKAGFKYDDRGQLFDSDGNRVRFTLLTNANNLVRVAIGAQVRQDLAKIGIQVDYNPINFNVLIDKTNGSRDWDAHMIGFTGGIEPQGLANLWMTSGGSHSFNLSQQLGQSKIQGYVANDWEKEIDRLFIQGAQELDLEKRKKIYGEFQKLVQEQLPVIHLVNDSALMAVRNRVKGLKYSGLPSWGLWNIYELRIEE